MCSARKEWEDESWAEGWGQYLVKPVLVEGKPRTHRASREEGTDVRKPAAARYRTGRLKLARGAAGADDARVNQSKTSKEERWTCSCRHRSAENPRKGREGLAINAMVPARF